MSNIHRLESMLSGEHGGVIGEAIRACNRRLDNHRATMDDFYARISTQDWYHDLSDQEDIEENRLSTRDANANAENQSGVTVEWRIDHLEDVGLSSQEFHLFLLISQEIRKLLH